MIRAVVLPLFIYLASPILVSGQAVREWSNVVFAERETGELRLDVIRPNDKEERPAVVCLFGGFWVKGEKETMHPLALELAELGYVAVPSSYRLSGTAPFPAQLEDVRAAIRYLREQSEDYGIDPNRIGVIGSSAGGHLAVLAATNVDCPQVERPNAAVGMGAQSDLTSAHIQNVRSGVSAENWSKYLGGLYTEVPDAYRDASPLSHLSGASAPVAFISGELDHASTHAERFRAAAFRLGVPTGLTIIPEAPHSLIRNQAHREAASVAIDEFFRLYLRPGRTGAVPIKIEPFEDADIALVPESDEWTRIGGGYGGCEGAQWLKGSETNEPELTYAAHHDHLLFRWSEERGLRLWEENTPETSTVRPSKEGFYAVEQQTRRLVRKGWRSGETVVLAETFEGKRLNRPNDLRVRPGKGTVWFTDPAFLFRTRPLETQEIPGQWVFRFDPHADRDTALSAPIRGLQIPNGIAFSRNGSRLYIGDSKQKKIFAYEVADNGEVSGDGRPIASFPNGLDGISVSPDDRLWVATLDGVSILTQEGQQVGFVALPGRCTSIDFVADEELHWVAITTRDAAHVAKFRFPKTKKTQLNQ